MSESRSLILACLGLAAIALVSFLIGPALSRLTRLPVITIYLAAGLLSQLFIASAVHEPMHELLQPVHNAALGCITFAAGGELVLEQLRANARAIGCITCSLTVWSYLLVFPLSFGTLIRYEPLGPGPVGLKAVMAMCAAVVAIARSPSSAIAVVAEERADGPFTQTVLGVTMVTDVVVIVLFTACIELADMALADGAAAQPLLTLAIGFLLRALLRIGLSLACGFWLALVGYLVLQLPKAPGCQEGGLLLLGAAAFYLEAGIRLMLRSYVPGALYESVRVEPMLSCILAGFLLCNQFGQRKRFGPLLHAVMRPALCFFFVTTGSSMQLGALRHSWPMTLGLCGSRMLALWCGSFFGSVCAGAPRESRDLGWLAYMTQAGVSLGLTDEIVDEFPSWGHRLQPPPRWQQGAADTDPEDPWRGGAAPRPRCGPSQPHGRGAAPPRYQTAWRRLHGRGGLIPPRPPLVSAIVINQLLGPPALKYALRAARESGGAASQSEMTALATPNRDRRGPTDSVELGAFSGGTDAAERAGALSDCDSDPGGSSAAPRSHDAR